MFIENDSYDPYIPTADEVADMPKRMRVRLTVPKMDRWTVPNIDPFKVEGVEDTPPF